MFDEAFEDMLKVIKSVAQVWFTVNDRFKQVLRGSNTPNFNLRKHHVTLASYRKD